MNFRSLFIDKDKIVMANMELGVALNSLDEAIVLNQLNYWIERNKNANNNFYDGHYWVYNSYEMWRKQDFPVWSATKIKRIFTSLEKKGIVLSANYNKLAIDKTKWYTIDYDRLEKFIDEYSKGQDETSKEDDDQPIDQNGQTSGQSERAIPETTTEITNRDYNTENRKDISPTELNTSLLEKRDDSNIPLTGLNTSLSEKREANSKKKPDKFKWVATKNHIISAMDKLGYGSAAEETEGAIEVFRYYYLKYKRKTGRDHPNLNNKTMISVLERFLYGTEGVNGADAEWHMELIEEHFKTNYGADIDWNIQHFMTEDIRNFLAQRCK